MGPVESHEPLKVEEKGRRVNERERNEVFEGFDINLLVTGCRGGA